MNTPNQDSHGPASSSTARELISHLIADLEDYLYLPHDNDISLWEPAFHLVDRDIITEELIESVRLMAGVWEELQDIDLGDEPNEPGPFLEFAMSCLHDITILEDWMVIMRKHNERRISKLYSLHRAYAGVLT